MSVEAIETPIVFQSQNKQLVGIYHQALVPAYKAVIIVVGIGSILAAILSW